MAQRSTPVPARDPSASDPPAGEQSALAAAGLPAPDDAEEIEVLQASIKAGSVAQIVIAIVAVLGLVYLLKIVFVTVLASLLIAFFLEPLVSRLTRLRIPRWMAAMVAVAGMVVLAAALTLFFYNRAVDFATALPKYSGRIRAAVGNIRSQTKKIEQGTRSVIDSNPDNAVPVQVQEAPGLSRVAAASSGVVGEILLSVSFVPFLVYFMLTWKGHAHLATVRLFPEEHRKIAFRTVARISTMIRSFIGSNILIGLLIGLLSSVVFWLLGIPYFYFIGMISGFLSLVPYLGVFLALFPPLAGGIDTLTKTGVLVVFISVIILHLATLNVLYPKLIGKRLRLNPLAVTLGLLFWAWIWGAMGLLLAVPIVGAAKIVCDHVESLRGLGAWLGD